MFTEDAMRKRFWEAKAEKERVEAESKPYRDQYAELNEAIERLRERQREAEAEFKRIEAPCYDLAMELAALARALKGKTGPAPEGN